MGTAVCSRWVNALNGTWLPFVKTRDDAVGPPLKAVPDAPVAGAPIDWPAVACATDALEGPKPAVVAEPPDTSPEPPVVPAADRINKLRKSTGLFWNPGFTSRTT